MTIHSGHKFLLKERRTGEGDRVNLPPDDACSWAVQKLIAVGGGARRSELEQWGIDRSTLNRLLRRGAIQRQGRGYYVLPWSSDTSGDRWQRIRSEHCRAVSAIASRGRVAGIRSAALVLGLPVVEVPPLPELLRDHQAASLRGARTVRRPPPREQVRLVNGVPVTSLERTAVDVALDLPTPEALITVDAAIRRGGDRQKMLAILEEMGSVRGCREARQTLDWADGHSESPLESRGRGELMLQGVPRPWSNVTIRFKGEEVRPDHWWEGLGIVGEADGAGKYDKTNTTDQPLWAERLRHGWLEEQLGLRVVRYVDREIRLAPQEVAARWRREVAWRERQPWEPPPGLEIFQRPLKGSGEPVRWFRRRGEG